tara:strand:+ start:63 stop:338 length:276 start_codon:yes stop_codon:yes gene_type:complete
MKTNKFISKFSNLKSLTKLHMSEIPIEIKQKIRNKAISNVEKSMISYGKTLDEMNSDDYEHIVCEEEEKIWKDIKGKSFNAILLVFFGVSF